MPDLPPAAETILVTGRAITPAAGAEAFGAIVLEGAELAPASGRVEDALRGLGGVQLFRTSSTRTANPTAEGITARGLAGNASSRLEVTLDGMPLADPFFGFISWGSLAGQSLQSAELVRGGGLGGPGALAGTLALTSAAASNRASVRLGSRESIDASAGLALGGIGLSGGLSRGDGHFLVMSPGPADVPARYRGWSLAASGRGEVDGTTVLARIGGFADQRLRGVVAADIITRGGDASLSVRHQGDWLWGLSAYARLRDFSTVTRTLDASRAVATTVLDQLKTPALGWGAELTVEPTLSEDMAVLLGAGWRASEGTTVEQFRYVDRQPTRGREAGGTQQIASLFANGSYRAHPNLLLTAASRLDRWRQGAGLLREYDLSDGAPTLFEPSAVRTGTEATVRLGLLWRPEPALRVRAAGYRGWRLPTLNELYRPFRAGQDATAANALLEPERLWGVEAGVGWQLLEAAELSLTAYWNRLENPVANVTIADGPGNFPGVGFVPAGGRFRQRQNLDAITSHGLEADARLAIGSWRIGGSAALVNARVEGGALDGFRPAQAPILSGSLSIGWEQAGWQASVALRHFGPRYEDDQNSRRLPPSSTVDVQMTMPLFSRIGLQLAAENLLDDEVATGFSGSQLERGQPRTLWIGLIWK